MGTKIYYFTDYCSKGHFAIRKRNILKKMDSGKAPKETTSQTSNQMNLQKKEPVNHNEINMDTTDNELSMSRIWERAILAKTQFGIPFAQSELEFLRTKKK